MSVNISYMGTKRELAPIVCEVLDFAQSGTILDVFSGMCSVAEAVAPKRRVWTNDVQQFAYEVGTALFTSKDEPLRPVLVADKHFDSYLAHYFLLAKNFKTALSLEEDFTGSSDFDQFSERYLSFKVSLRDSLTRFRGQGHNLFCSLYSDSFFSLKQAIQADAIVKSICSSLADGKISHDERRWLLIGLGRALLKVSNSTGHFAQFLKPKAQSYSTFNRQRKRCVWSEWLTAADEMEAVGTSEWRRDNKSFHLDALDLLSTISSKRDRPSVIYADPPYTDDQYSRFYHVLETLVLYDYPRITGAGRYRADRFQTPFSIKSQANGALTSLIELTARTGADLVLSYPTNGLAYETGFDPGVLMRKHFTKVESCRTISHQHSTLGASKGPSKATVTEQIYLGRQ